MYSMGVEVRNGSKEEIEVIIYNTNFRLRFEIFGDGNLMTV